VDFDIIPHRKLLFCNKSLHNQYQPLLGAQSYVSNAELYGYLTGSCRVMGLAGK